jgi:hypothetical protein
VGSRTVLDLLRAEAITRSMQLQSYASRLADLNAGLG